MDTIKNYLESMFASLPATEEVMKAKSELYSMMEDKYNELIDEGKSENEAVGIVISEFGNLDELASSLGIAGVMKDADPTERHNIPLEEAKDYIADKTRHMFFIALAVFLFIISPIGPISFGSLPFIGEKFVSIGVVVMFLLVAAGVGIIVFSSVVMNKWSFMDDFPCSVDYATSEYIYRERQYNRGNRAVLLTIGIMLCIVSIIPTIIVDSLFPAGPLSDTFQGIFLFAMVGVGVMLIIFSGGKESAYRKLLSLNGEGTVSGSYESVRSGKKDSRAKAVMDVYWSTVTSIYLIYSFLTFKWYISWIIWPIAGVLSGIVKLIVDPKGE